MRIKKRLKEEVEYTDRKILEEGQQLKAELIASYCVPTQKSTPIYKRKSFIATMCCVLVCILTVGIVLPITLNNSTIRYSKENEVTSETTLANIYSAINFKLNEEKFSLTYPQKTEDSITGDILYYSIKVDATELFPYGLVELVTNKNYEYPNTPPYKSDCVWKGCSVSFMATNSNSDGLPTVQVVGCVDYKNVSIYFSYTDMDTGEPISPNLFLESLILD